MAGGELVGLRQYPVRIVVNGVGRPEVKPRAQERYHQQRRHPEHTGQVTDAANEQAED
ncbi:hypothetical protein AWRIB429_2102 [Oenococcus oeni AWRIB429]|uniref:Uncharacterized protein n=1 Tax=Oenococcus oeni AWRIB429 TaxID=655225 RepID=D3LCM3_OENOE|nr:hypothetical protein AWRIB429_2102 [Oenococcus oeni AWRIB429]